MEDSVDIISVYVITINKTHKNTVKSWFYQGLDLDPLNSVACTQFTRKSYLEAGYT